VVHQLANFCLYVEVLGEALLRFDVFAVNCIFETITVRVGKAEWSEALLFVAPGRVVP
jgi:hypothetical protein